MPHWLRQGFVAGGIAPERDVPRFAPEPFKAWFRRRGIVNAGAPQVPLWPDTFNNYFHPRVAKSAVEVLEHAGFQVIVPEPSLCCGRPLYDFGILKTAKSLLLDVLSRLSPVGLEPSCLAVFRDVRRSVLAVTVIDSPREMHNVRLAIGSNAASVWWVNGKEVIGIYGDRQTVIDDGVSKRLTLNKGANVVRAAIVNGGGATDFCARFLDADDKPIANLAVNLSVAAK